MPTYREDLHLGHKVALWETDDIADKAITHDKLADDSVDTNNLRDKSVTEPKLDDGSVSTRTMQNKAVTFDKLSDELWAQILNEMSVRFQEFIAHIEEQIEYIMTHCGVISEHFGNSPYVGVSQKTLTEAINRIWTKFSDMTGETLQGITLTVNPDYFISEDAMTVHVTAYSQGMDGDFEVIRFYANGELVGEYENTSFVEFDFEITDTTIIGCKAQVMGIEYQDSKTVSHYRPYFMGAAQNYTQIMDVEHIVPVTTHMRGNYNVTFTQGDKLFIVMSKSFRSAFMRADINGIEIAFNESNVVIDDVDYVVFESVNAFSAGTLNIDING